MPGPNIVNRARQAQQTAATQRATYYLTDPHATEILGMPVTDTMREQGLILSASEAMTLVASGAITTDKAAADKAGEEMKTRLEALAKKRQAEAEAAAANNEASAAAALHNAGEQTMSQSDLDKSNKAVAGTLSPEEVDARLATPPTADAAPAAPASAEQQGTWADQQHAS